MTHARKLRKMAEESTSAELLNEVANDLELADAQMRTYAESAIGLIGLDVAECMLHAGTIDSLSYSYIADAAEQEAETDEIEC